MSTYSRPGVLWKTVGFWVLSIVSKIDCYYISDVHYAFVCGTEHWVSTVHVYLYFNSLVGESILGYGVRTAQ
uniref:Putative secreted protein n=1 Tax=Anopheles darlingi TaxID=43151 RepID=A0A2M4DE75_ANODA